MSAPVLVVINLRKDPWRLTRYEGRKQTDVAELLVPKGADAHEVKAVIEQFRVNKPQ